MKLEEIIERTVKDEMPQWDYIRPVAKRACRRAVREVLLQVANDFPEVRARIRVLAAELEDK